MQCGNCYFLLKAKGTFMAKTTYSAKVIIFKWGLWKRKQCSSFPARLNMSIRKYIYNAFHIHRISYVFNNKLNYWRAVTFVIWENTAFILFAPECHTKLGIASWIPFVSLGKTFHQKNLIDNLQHYKAYLSIGDQYVQLHLVAGH